MPNEPEIDYVQTRRALGSPRYALRFYFLKLTWTEAAISLLAGCLLLMIINVLDIGTTKVFFIELDPFAWIGLSLSLAALFCSLHKFRNDLSSWELLTSLLVPKQFSDRGDRTWRPRGVKSAAPRKKNN